MLKMGKKNEEVNIESLLEYINKINKVHSKHKEFTGKIDLMFIEIKLLECRLNYIDKNLQVKKNDN